MNDSGVGGGGGASRWFKGRLSPKEKDRERHCTMSPSVVKAFSVTLGKRKIHFHTQLLFFCSDLLLLNHKFSLSMSISSFLGSPAVCALS